MRPIGIVILKPRRYLSLAMPRTCGEVIPRYNISPEIYGSPKTNPPKGKSQST